MKMYCIIVFMFVMVGCAGTMSGNRSEGGPFSIGSKGGTINGDFYLISIRDSGLVILPISKDLNNASSYQDALFLRNDSIKWIQHKSLKGFSFLGGVIGSAAGTVGGVLIGSAGKTGLSALKQATYGGIVGFPLGMFIGAAVMSPQSSFDVHNPDDREKLYYLCKYCGFESYEINNVR